jgi:hypothetical protein
MEQITNIQFQRIKQTYDNNNASRSQDFKLPFNGLNWRKNLQDYSRSGRPSAYLNEDIREIVT